MLFSVSRVCVVVGLTLLLQSTVAGRAPDVAPDLPDGWCDLRYGSPTRSTGECICTSNCQGARCRKESGVIWFAYAECPTCQCVSKDVQTKFTAAEEESSRNAKQQERQEQFAPEDIQPVEEPEESFDIVEWFDDNFNYIFASIVSLVVFFIGFTIIGDILSSSKRDSSQGQPMKSKSKSKGDSNREEDVSDSAKSK